MSFNYQTILKTKTIHPLTIYNKIKENNHKKKEIKKENINKTKKCQNKLIQITSYKTQRKMN